MRMHSDIIDMATGVIAGGIWAAKSILSGRALPLPPMLSHCGKRVQHVHSTQEYAPGLKLDVWRPPGALGAKLPVLVFIPGGGWAVGQRQPQGYALMSHLVDAGWICVAMDYRTAPRHRWPAPFEDVTAACQWVRENIAAHGGDPDFVTLAGASAGGHMAVLAALTWAPHIRPPEAVIGLYGSYDWEDRSTPYRAAFMRYLETVVVGKRQAKRPDIFRNASPLANVHAGVPPILLVHGTRDRLCPVSEARRLAAALGRHSDSPVSYCEIDGGAHAFDLVSAPHTARAIEEIDEFLHRTYADWMYDSRRAS